MYNIVEYLLTLDGRDRRTSRAFSWRRFGRRASGERDSLGYKPVQIIHTYRHVNK